MTKIILLYVFFISCSTIAQNISFNFKYSSTLSEKSYPSYSLEGTYGFNEEQFEVGLLMGYSNIPLDFFITDGYKTSYKTAGIVAYYFPFRFSPKVDSSLYLTIKATKLYGTLETGWGGMIFEEGFYNSRSVNDYTFLILGGYKINLELFNFLIEFGLQYRTYTEQVDWYIIKDSTFPVFHKTLEQEVKNYSTLIQLGLQFAF